MTVRMPVLTEAIIAAVLVAVPSVLFARESEGAFVGGTPGKVSVADEQKTYWDSVKDAYTKAKEAGEDVPEDVVQWAKDDIRKIGTWQYKVVVQTDAGTGALEGQLNDLGAQRWNCFHVQVTPDGTLLFLKRPCKSYLQAAGRVAKFIPIPDGDK